MSEAEDRYLAEIADDCEELLGPGIEVQAVERRDAPPGVKLTVRYRVGQVEMVTEAGGDTIVAAHADLRSRLVVDRVRMAFAEAEGAAISH